MFKKIVVGVLVTLFVIGGSFSHASAQSMNSSQLVDLFISTGIISPDKADFAREAVKGTNVDSANAPSVTSTSSKFSVFLNSLSISKVTGDINSSTGIAQELATATFNLKLKAIDGDYIFSTNEDSFRFVLYFNGVKTSYVNLDKKVFATLPSTGVVTKGLPLGQFKLLKNREVTIPVTFQFSNKLTDGMFIEKGSYAVGLDSVTGTNRSGQKVVVNFMIGNVDWITSPVSMDGVTRIITQPTVTVISPNGGEVYKDNYNQTSNLNQIPVQVMISNTNQIGNLNLYWTTTNDPLLASSNRVYFGGVQGIDNITANPYVEYRTTSYANLKPGKYFLFAEWVPTSGTNIGLNRIDMSDSYFTIASSTTTVSPVFTVVGTPTMTRVAVSLQDNSGVATSTGVGNFNLSVTAVGGDIVLGGPESSRPLFSTTSSDSIMIHRNGAPYGSVASVTALGTTALVSYMVPSSGVDVTNDGWILRQNNAIQIPVTVQFTISGWSANTYAVELKNASWTSLQTGTAQTSLVTGTNKTGIVSLASTLSGSNLGAVYFSYEDVVRFVNAMMR